MGVDDGSFQFRGLRNRHSEKALLVAVLVEDTKIVALRLERITIDGLDATARLNRLLKELTFDAILLRGISFAGFNLVDAEEIYRSSKKPVIVISTTRPNNHSMKKALTAHFSDWKTRWAIIQKLGKIHQIRSWKDAPPLFFEVVGTSERNARRLIKDSAKLSRLPEPVRVADFVAKGLSTCTDPDWRANMKYLKNTTQHK